MSLSTVTGELPGATSHDGSGGESGLEMYKRFRSDLESATGGRGCWDIGYPNGWTYPIRYDAQQMPPFMEQLNFLQGLKPPGGAGPQITTQLQPTQEDIAVMKKKMDVLNEAHLHKMFFKIWHPFDDDVRKKMLIDIWPEPFERMRENVIRQAEEQKEGQLRRLGPLTKENIIYKIALAENPEFQSRVLDQPIGPVRLAGTAEQQESLRDMMFIRGWFNPMAAIRAKQMRRVMEETAKAQKDYVEDKLEPTIKEGAIQKSTYWGDAFGGTLPGLWVAPKEGVKAYEPALKGSQAGLSSLPANLTFEKGDAHQRYMGVGSK
jgi:hypothetical protein